MLLVNEKLYNVLFLCTGNSARSVLAEVLLNHIGRGKFKAYSAGSYPKGEVHPFTITTLQSLKLPTEGLRSKNWEEFAQSNSPELHFVFTVCDNAAGEVCPIWPGQPMTAHWGVEDPAVFEGSDEEKRKRFGQVAQILRRRIELFTSLPLMSLDKMALEKKIKDIGKVNDDTSAKVSR